MNKKNGMKYFLTQAYYSKGKNWGKQNIYKRYNANSNNNKLNRLARNCLKCFSEMFCLVFP
ncbi:hypothetical protein AD998_04090 [bacterium 336/3]|nr:hypothetical protein AD998_04090 [bacterium 336/3]